MDSALEAAHLQSQWQLLCDGTARRAQQTARQCLPEFGELCVRVAERFVRLPAPQAKPEYDGLQLLAVAIVPLMGSIAHASLMSRSNPAARAALLDAARKLSEVEMPPTGAGRDELRRRCAEFTGAVSAICHRHRPPF